jgi:tetratricopeptide (TPR) repeat protein
MRIRRLACLPLLGLVTMAGCGRGEEPPVASSTQSAERQQVLRFWDRFNAATAARIARDCRKASGLYEEALALDPTHEDSLYYLGQCSRELGEVAKARLAFDRLVEVNPASARGHLALAALLASPEPSEPMDLPRAEAHLRRAHEINGEETGPIVHLGEVLIVEGKLAEARTWLESALRTNPRSVESAFLAGYVAWEEHDERTAERFAERAREGARVEAPVKGVSNEGDRKVQRGAAAPPLAEPLGRTFFGEMAAFVREASRAGRSARDADFIAAWRRVRSARREYRHRAGP